MPTPTFAPVTKRGSRIEVLTLPPFATPTPPAAAAVPPRGSRPGGKRDRFLVSSSNTVDTNPSTRGPSKTTTPTTFQESKGNVEVPGDQQQSTGPLRRVTVTHSSSAGECTQPGYMYRTPARQKKQLLKPCNSVFSHKDREAIAHVSGLSRPPRACAIARTNAVLVREAMVYGVEGFSPSFPTFCLGWRGPERLPGPGSLTLTAATGRT